MYILIEMQTNNGTTAIVPPTTYSDLSIAYQAYYTALAAAAVSNVQIHTVVLMTPIGQIVRVETFNRVPESEPDK